MWTWFQLTDHSFEALRTERVPESVLEKIGPLKDKDYSRSGMAKEITKVLDLVEIELYRDLILNHAIVLQGKARKLKRLNRLSMLFRVIFFSMFPCFPLLMVLGAGIGSIIPFGIGMIALILAIGMQAEREDLLKRIPLGSKEDYSQEFSGLSEHPANFKPALLIPVSFFTRMLLWLGAILIVFVLTRTHVIDGFFCCFVWMVVIVLMPLALFTKFPKRIPDQSRDEKPT
jgi:hypothetical protein